MAKSKYQASRGTFDVLPGSVSLREQVERTAAEICARAGYESIRTPIFEETQLFERGVGRSTDIVQKEMFTFQDKGERSLTLRPEGTAPICRAYLEHGLNKWPQPVKLSYGGPFFRHERPQAGRYRQFHQFGIEAIGTETPLADAEAIGLLFEVLTELGVPGIELRLGSLGSAEARRAYLVELRAYLRKHEAELPGEVRERIETNPLRAFDSKHEGVQALMRQAPKLIDRIEGEDARHFEEVRSLLDAAGVPYRIDPTLVRGLDYYSRTIFSFTCDRLGAQSEIGGGGRYDGLIEQLGGKPTPAVGWAAGIERIMLALEDDESPREERLLERDVFIAFDAEQANLRSQATVVAAELRRTGLSVEIDLGARGMKGQLKCADRLGARYTLILNDEGPRLRDMESGRERSVVVANLPQEIAEGVE